MIVTFDIVYHPGFGTSVLGFTKLNENFNQNKNEKVSLTIYETNIGKLDNLYESYINNNEAKNINFLQWVVAEKLFESENLDKKEIKKSEKEKNKKDEKVMEDKELPSQDKVENQLSKAVDTQLSESQKYFHKQMKDSLNKLNKAVYDDSAGFVTSGLDIE